MLPIPSSSHSVPQTGSHEQIDPPLRYSTLSNSLGKLNVSDPATKRRPPALPPRVPRKPVALSSQSTSPAEQTSVASSSTDTLVTTSPPPLLGSLNPFRPKSTIWQTEPAAPGQSNPFRTVVSSPPVQSPTSATDSNIFIGVVGITGSGKSTFIRNVTGFDQIVVGDGLKSETRQVNEASVQIGQSTVTLVDTPGFNDTEFEDDDIFYMLVDWLKKFHLKGQKFSALLYLHPINKTRKKGSDKRSLNIFKKLVGASNYNSITIGLTHLDTADPQDVESRERELRESPDAWADMIRAGASVVRLSKNKTDCIDLISKMMVNQTITLQAEDELFKQNKSVTEISAAQEMQDYQELKLIQLREEMEASAQQMLFDERMRLTAQFSEERAELERQIFEERLAKQLLEEEVLTWKMACEKEQHDAKTLQLQYDKEEELRKQKAEQKRREDEAETEKKAMEETNKTLDRKERMNYAEVQYKKALAEYCPKATLLLRYHTIATKSDNFQRLKFFDLKDDRNRTVVTVDLRCNMCWSVISFDEPWLCHDAESMDMRICPSERCMAVWKDFFDWKVNWQYHLSKEGTMSCRRNKTLAPGYGLVCSLCREQLLGYYVHCCECASDDFDMCLECWAMKKRGCYNRKNHGLRLGYQWNPNLSYACIKEV